MKTVQEAIREIDDQAVCEGIGHEWFFDFPLDIIKMPPDDAAQWLIDVLGGHQYADTYVAQFLCELSDQNQPTQQFQQWFNQVLNHPEFDGLY